MKLIKHKSLQAENMVVSATLWVIWRCRNDVIFDREKISDPMEIVKMLCGWISDWAILQKRDPEVKMLMLGAKLIKKQYNGLSYGCSQRLKS